VDLSVVTVTYNSADVIVRCLESALASAPSGSEHFVVDNASSDGTVALVRERFPSVRLIGNPRNVGFGTANNQAIRQSFGRYVTLLNPDSEVPGDSLAALVRFMDAHPRAAVAGGRLRYADGRFQDSAFHFPTLAQIFLDYFPIDWRLAQSRLNGRYPRGLDCESFQIDHPLGALMCVRRAAIEQVGPFDEGYFMYVEEVDWCYRFKRAGWEVWHCPEALAIHHGGRSTGQRAGEMLAELHRSRLRFYRKHYPAWFRMGARIIVTAGMATQMAADWLADLRAGGSPERRAHARVCLEIMRL
jgi:hypothetical protein